MPATPNIKPNRCRYCNEMIVGRSDKKFCNNHCRSAYHNNYVSGKEAYISTINQQLRKNRAALHKACPIGKATVRITYLEDLGMDFRYHTHTWRSSHNNLYYMCYDYGYMYIKEPNKVLIIQEQQYMKK